jgi:hypothetical protein
MPLELTDSRWKKLKSGYGGIADVVAWLKEAGQGNLSSELIGNLVNEVRHQGDTSTAMYAVAPHLISLAHQAPPEKALILLTHAGLIYASSDSPGAVQCPSFLREEFTASALEGAASLAPRLPLAKGFDTFKYAVAALAGFTGHRAFARFLDGLDFFEGQFHHSLLDEPFPPEE